MAGFVVGTVVFALVLDAFDASWAPWPDAAIFIGTALAFLLQSLGLVEFCSTGRLSPVRRLCARRR